MALARIAEGLPTPHVTAEETPAERLVRSGRITSIVLIIIAAIFGPMLCILTIAGVVIFVMATQ